MQFSLFFDVFVSASQPNLSPSNSVIQIVIFTAIRFLIPPAIMHILLYHISREGSALFTTYSRARRSSELCAFVFTAVVAIAIVCSAPQSRCCAVFLVFLFLFFVFIYCTTCFVYSV
ncbi:hypothetical protein K435DRAFT_974832 [Dendrothele bispora CBS 962.96]|uniref:Uncharacterized protein n=1 Tax=Dendrothele bispora (strain CBS 962.96) TaxID=1314807 RepID=A0A4S8KJ69_DENBC|nr:hypothetical protein K435DRAFT_974832 [Dendrothele bispora CBS 962.96]